MRALDTPVVDEPTPSQTSVCAACGAETPLPTDNLVAPRCDHCGADPRLDGRYRLDAIIGRGAIGVTYRATNLAGGATVAIKEMPFRHTDPEEVRRLVEREASVLGQLRHPAIPDYVEHMVVGTGKSRALYLVQELIEGQTLEDEMARRRYSEDEVVAILVELCRVLEYLHRLHPPVIHRDLKPHNIMRRTADGRGRDRGAGQLVLMDFGSVRDAFQDPQMGGRTVAGTFGYMAPEQFRGDAFPQSDLYALGVTAVVLLSRRAPEDLMVAGQTLEWEAAVRVADPLRAILADLLEPDPAQRAKDAGAVRRRLEQLDGGAPRASTSGRRRRRAGRRGAAYAEEARDGAPEDHADASNPRRARGRTTWSSSREGDGRKPGDPPVTWRGAGRLDQDAAEVSDERAIRPYGHHPPVRATRDRRVAAILAFVGGAVGAHQWYLGRYGWGIVHLALMFTGISTLLGIIGGIRLVYMDDETFDRQYNG